MSILLKALLKDVHFCSDARESDGDLMVAFPPQKHAKNNKTNYPCSRASMNLGIGLSHAQIRRPFVLHGTTSLMGYYYDKAQQVPKHRLVRDAQRVKIGHLPRWKRNLRACLPPRR